MARTPKVRKTAEQIKFGSNPANLDFTKLPVFELVKAYNHYNYMYSHKDAKAILEKAYPKIKWSNLKKSEINPTVAWIYLLERDGCVFDTKTLVERDEYLSKSLGLSILNKKQEAAEENKPKEEPRFVDKVHIADFDDIIDYLYDSFDIVGATEKAKVLCSALNKSQIDELIAIMTAQAEELGMIPKNKDVVQAYSQYTKSNIRVATKFFTELKSSLEFVKEVKKASRKPRKKKVITIDKKLKNFKYQAAFPALELVSINPETVIGSKILWTFNTKTRELTHFQSDEGFDVKGTTLVNGTKAKVKRVRKPDFIKTFKGLAKLRMPKEFAALKVNERDANYRINQDTILLKAFN